MKQFILSLSKYNWSERIKAKMRRTITILIVLIPFIGFAQNFADKEYYLVDSLVLEELTEPDKKLLNNSLKLYHAAKDDTSKINALNDICENMMHNDWSKFQFLQHLIIEKALKAQPSNQKKGKLLKSLAGALNNIGYIYGEKGDITKQTEHLHESLKIYVEIGDKGGIATSLNNIGLIYYNQGDMVKAIDNFKSSLIIQEEIGDQGDVAISLNNIGHIYQNQGDISMALEYFHKSLKILEKIGDKKGIAASLGNIGIIYQNQGDISKALEYYQKSLKIEKEIGNKKGIAMSLNNIGFSYNQQGNIPKAIEYYNKSLKLREDIGDLSGIATSLNNIGGIYENQGHISEALDYYYKALRFYEKIGDKDGIISSLNNIGGIMIINGNIEEAQKNVHRSLIIAQEIGYPELIKNAAKLLSKIYERQNKGMQALEMHKLYITMKDSINNEATQKATAKQQAKYEYEKQKVLDDAEHDKRIAVEKEEKEKQQVITYVTGVGLGLVAIFLFFVFNRLQVTKRQKLVIEDQKKEVENQKEVVELAHSELEEKNQEIMDSITYAKRIQSAILPPDKVVKEYLQDSFILYKPKDIVAGDFYWMESVKKERHSALDAESPQNRDTANKSEIAGQSFEAFASAKHAQDDIRNDGNLVLFAAADCTGHGVPGAMVSVVCNNALNRSVREYSLTDPGEILNKTREIVLQEFEKSDEEVKDGMDIALCSLQGTTLQYAGAHNPLWIVRSTRHSELVPIAIGTESPEKSDTAKSDEIAGRVRNDDYIIYETKANKQPIGKFDNPEPYTTHVFELQKGDTIYIFSDGFVDQFGGEKGKKFKAKAFRTLLLSLQDKPMEEQCTIIDEAFETWKGDLEQIDDVCIIGVRI